MQRFMMVWTSLPESFSFASVLEEALDAAVVFAFGEALRLASRRAS